METKALSRESNIELLRVFAMLLVVTTHTFGHYIDMKGSIYPFPNGYTFYFTMSGIAQICVNTYVMIGAYFLCTSKFKAKRLVRLWLEVIFYSLCIGGLRILFEGEGGVKSFILMFFPILGKQWGFATLYMGLLILSPFINIFIKSLSERSHRYFCFTLLVLFSVIPTFISEFSTWLTFGNGVGIVWFITLYFIASYIRLYVNKDFLYIRKSKIGIIAVALCLSPVLSRFMIVFTTYVLLGSPVAGGLFYSYNSILVAAATIANFLFFLTIIIRSPKISDLINFAAKATFGVFLIHEHPWVRSLLASIASTYIDTNSVWFPLQSVIWIFAIYFVCSLMDIVRQMLFTPIDKAKMQWTNKIDDNINSL